MTDHNASLDRSLPHHRLIAYQAAVRLLLAVKEARIRDTGLRDQALRAAKSTCLNIAEAVGRVSRADKARVYAIARGELIETVAAVEIASLTEEASTEAATRCVALGNELYALLTGLLR